MRSGAGRSRSTVKPEGTSDNNERGSRIGHGKQTGSCQYGRSSRTVHRPAPKVRKNPSSSPIDNRHKTVCHGRGEYARDEDGDGFCEIHVNTMEGAWSLLRSWLRPHRGI